MIGPRTAKLLELVAVISFLPAILIYVLVIAYFGLERASGRAYGFVIFSLFYLGLPRALSIYVSWKARRLTEHEGK